MTIFLTLLTNLLPLYALIAMGYVGGKIWQIDTRSLANLCVFIVSPIVIFGFVAHLELHPEYAVLPFVAFFLMAITSVIFYGVGRKVYGDSRANLLAMCTAHANTGYFGLPLVLILLPADSVGIYMFMLLGGNLFEATFSYYFAARGKFNVRDSLRKLTHLPMIYAMLAGLAVNVAHVDLPLLFDTYWAYFKGAYVVVGMMIIGAALAKVPRLVIAPKFLFLTFLGKFVFCPLLAAAFIACDRAFLHLFSTQIHQMIMIIALVPPGANIVAYAAQMDLRPEKAASTILLGTFFALFYIPAVLALFGF